MYVCISIDIFVVVGNDTYIWSYSDFKSIRFPSVDVHEVLSNQRVGFFNNHLLID